MIRAKISPLNGIRFVPMDITVPAIYNSPDFDKEWFYEAIKPWQTKVRYTQKVQSSDPFRMQLWTNADNNKTLTVLNCSGASVVSKNFALNPMAPTVSDSGIAYSVYDVIDNGMWNDILTSDGSAVYYILIQLQNVGGSEKLSFISEPIYLKEKHENTLFIEYQNSYNKDSIVFEQTNLVLGMRVEGSVTEFMPTVNRTVFEDQGYNKVQLSGTATRQWKAIFGADTSAIPDYMTDKLNHIFACDRLRIDGTNYSQIDGSALEIDREDVYPLVSASIVLGEPDNMKNSQYSGGALTVIEDMNFPFCLFKFSLGEGDMPSYIIPQPIEFTVNNTTGYLNYLNSSALDQGLSGTFSKVGNSLIYTLGSGEYFNTAITQILTDPILVNCTNFQDLTANTSSITFKLGSQAPIAATNIPYALFGNNDIVSEKLAYGYITSTELPGSEKQFDITTNFPPSSSNVVVRIYTTPDINTLWITGARVHDITQWPDKIREVVILGSHEIESFSIYPTMSPYRETLFNFSIVDCPNLTDFGVMSPNSTTIQGICLNLKHIYCWNGTALTSANVDKFINSVILAVYYSGYNVSGSDFKFSGQNPTAPPTSASQSARNYIVNAGGSLLTD